MSYGKSWEKFPIERGEVWIDKQSNSMISVNDITYTIPEYMLSAEMVYCDPPWSLGNVNMFNSKAGRQYMNHFSEFYNSLFNAISKIKPLSCYLEVGKLEVNTFRNKIKEIFPIVQEWKITYYGNKPCFLLRGGISEVSFDFSMLDDTKTPSLAIRAENPKCVADFCTGRGLTAVGAMENDIRFVGTELNKRKLAVCIDNCNKKGMNYANSVY